MKENPLIEDMHPGLSWSYARKVTGVDVRASVDLARDHGGYHVDERYARAAGFSGLITSGCFHVTLIAGLGGRVNLLGRELTVRFAGPIYEGDALEAMAEVQAVAPDKREVTLDIRVRNQHGADVALAQLTGYMPAAEWGRPERPPSEA